MSSVNTTGSSQIRSEETKKIVDAFGALSTDDKLALLYWAYKKMGDSITPAAPTATEPQLAPMLLDDFYNLSDDEQLNIMRDIVNRKDTEYSRAYGALTPNNQLVVWYAWAVAMGDRVVDMPNDYEQTQAIEKVLSQVENAEFEEQISLLREAASNMGYSEIGQVSRQSQTGTTPSL